MNKFWYLNLKQNSFFHYKSLKNNIGKITWLLANRSRLRLVAHWWCKRFDRHRISHFWSLLRLCIDFVTLCSSFHKQKIPLNRWSYQSLDVCTGSKHQTVAVTRSSNRHIGRVEQVWQMFYVLRYFWARARHSGAALHCRPDWCELKVKEFQEKSSHWGKYF